MVAAWLDYRERFGFSEFNAEVYGKISYKALVPVSALAPDEDLRTRAKMVQHLQELDHVIGSKGKRISTARGRAYTEGKIDGYTYSFMQLIKDLGR